MDLNNKPWKPDMIFVGNTMFPISDVEKAGGADYWMLKYVYNQIKKMSKGSKDETRKY